MATSTKRKAIPLSIRRRVWEVDGGVCHYCGVELPVPGNRRKTTAQIDHIVPVVHGGTDEFDNLVLTCKQCNRRKKDRDYWEFISDEIKRLRKHLNVLKSLERKMV